MVFNSIYLVLTLFSIYFGWEFGFGNSHTPPLPFVVSTILLIIGVILIFLKKLFKDKYSYKIHLGLTFINFLVVIICLLLTFI